MNNSPLDRQVIDNYAQALGGQVVKELIHMYIQDATLRRDTLLSLLPDNLTALGLEAHAIKGASANLGLTQVAEIARDLQHACDQKDLALAQPLARDLVQALDLGLVQLESVFNEL